MKKNVFILLLIIFPFILVSCNSSEEPKKRSILRSCTWEGYDGEYHYDITFLPGTLGDISPTLKDKDIKKPDVNGGIFDEQGVVYLYYRYDQLSPTVKRKGVYFLYNNNLIITCFYEGGIDKNFVIDRNYIIEVFNKDRIVLKEMGYKSENVLVLTPHKSSPK